MVEWTEYTAAKKSVNAAAVAFLGAPIPLQKKDPEDPFTETGFLVAVLQIAEGLAAATAGARRAALKAMAKKLRVDWPGLSEAAKGKAIAEAMAPLLGVHEVSLPKFLPVFVEAGESIVAASKGALGQRFDLDVVPSLSLPDKLVIQHAAASQAHYLRLQDGKRHVGFSKIARGVASQGAAEGLDKHAIASRMEAVLRDTEAARTRSYYTMLSSVFTARSRTYANAVGFEEAGIEYAEWLSVRDEATTELCRYMHGHIIRVGSVLDGYRDVALSEDPEAVKEIQPWGGTEKTEDGATMLFYKRGGQRVRLAEVLTSGKGLKGASGTYDDYVGKDVSGTGIVPPAHGSCRSLLAPYFGRSMGVVP